MPKNQQSEDELKRLQEQRVEKLLAEFNKNEAVKNQREYERELKKISNLTAEQRQKLFTRYMN